MRVSVFTFGFIECRGIPQYRFSFEFPELGSQLIPKIFSLPFSFTFIFQARNTIIRAVYTLIGRTPFECLPFFGEWFTKPYSHLSMIGQKGKGKDINTRDRRQMEHRHRVKEGSDTPGFHGVRGEARNIKGGRGLSISSTGLKHASQSLMLGQMSDLSVREKNRVDRNLMRRFHLSIIGL
ncbi:hypothetical protein FRC14_007399 [Serendipita sp. 396]|nr:hypothetical protein FRC14_007399 [Serendipita sp. 396]KAG8862666.1 hypothetical protein FRC20_011117 [Serendipita sp. 405]